MPLKAPLLMIRPLIVSPDEAAAIAPLAVSVVTPVTAPAVETFRPEEARLKAAVALPIVVAALPVVLIPSVPVIVDAPVTLTPPESVVRPATPRVPPKLVAPVPTVKVLIPVMLVFPLSETAPVPVSNVPPPVWAKLPVSVMPPVGD